MNINLKEWQINIVLKALAKMPYEEVCETIADIKQQYAAANNSEISKE